MSSNPVARLRLIGSATMVLLVLAAVGASIASIGPSGLTWAWVIGGTAIAYAVLSAIMHRRHPEAGEAAWDEQNTTAHRDALIFGFWATLVTFLIFLALVLTDRLDPAMAFFWLGPVLGAAPSAHYLASILRGRAE